MGFMCSSDHLKFLLSLKGGCTGLSESTLVKMPHCLKSHVTAHLLSASKNKWLSRVYSKKLLFLYLNQNICCGYSKEPSQLSTQNIC